MECKKVPASIRIGVGHGEVLWEEAGGLSGQIRKASVQLAFLRAGGTCPDRHHLREPGTQQPFKEQDFIGVVCGASYAPG